MRKLFVATFASTLLLTYVQAFAQAPAGWREIPNGNINAEGYRQSGFKASKSGVGCVGSVDYQNTNKLDDKGKSERRWTASKSFAGGTLCTGGSWYYGGQRAGQVGGSFYDVLILNGKFYRK